MTHNAENVPPLSGTEVERLTALADNLAGRIARVEALTESATDFDEVGLGWVSVSEDRAALDGFPHEARGEHVTGNAYADPDRAADDLVPPRPGDDMPDKWNTEAEPCRFGYEEHDGARYCFAHAGFLEAGVQSRRCDRARIPADLPGMWERADLVGGDPDERSHAERTRVIPPVVCGHPSGEVMLGRCAACGTP